MFPRRSAPAKRPSIRRQILFSACSILLTLCAVLVAIEFTYAYRASDRVFDRGLASAALSIADTVEVQDGIYVDMPSSAFAILGISGVNRVFYRVVGPDGEFITGSPTLGIELTPKDVSQPQFHDSVYRGEPIRLAIVSRFVSSETTTGWISIFVAETREAREAFTVELLGAIIAPIVLVVAVAIFFIGLAIHKAFEALKTVEDEIDQRQPSDLTPLKSGLPEEVVKLGDAMNGFMERFSMTLQSLNRLTIDTSHQIQTPLAAIRAQAEVGLDEAKSPTQKRRFKRIFQRATQVSELARDLLTDATLVHRLGSGTLEAVSLDDAVKAVVQGIEPRKRRPIRIVLSSDAKAAGTTVLADRIALRELIANLIDNALKHGKGATELRIDRDDGQVRLTVSDRGPGLPDDQLEAVFERYYRLDDEKPGSGLGLPIARMVAQALAGELRLGQREGGGLEAILVLPATTSAPQERVRDDD